MHNLGKKSQGGPAEKFMLFYEAMELAQSGGNAGLTLEAVEAMSAEFQVDALEGKQKATIALSVMKNIFGGPSSTSAAIPAMPG